EIVLEGYVSKDETAQEGPYGDHTGYYNSVESFPVVHLSALTTRRSPVYLTTYTGRPPDEPSVLGEAMTELFVPMAKRHFPEIRDLW
ncbi:UbiD family decarboxylase domain-containing protein, partial [Rhizobium ruizarguesonis]